MRYLRVFREAQFPCGLKRPDEHIFAGFCEPDVGCAHSSPATVDRQEKIRHFLDEHGLPFGIEHEIAVTLIGRGESGEDTATDPEIDGSHVGAFFGAFEAEGDAMEIGGCHGSIFRRKRTGINRFSSATRRADISVP